MKLFEVTDRLSTALQSKAMTAGRGVHLVNEAVAELQRFRDDATFEGILGGGNEGERKDRRG